MDVWCQQILVHSKRDQLSLLPSCWSQEFSVEYLPLEFERFELLDWPVVIDGIRLPRDFDDDRYAQLNPDVRRANVNCRKHYLQAGFKEQRRYK